MQKKSYFCPDFVLRRIFIDLNRVFLHSVFFCKKFGNIKLII